MSGYYYQTNKDIANSFLEDNLHKVTEEQIKIVKDLMKYGETDFVKHQIEKGGKQLSLELSDEPKGKYEKYDVVIETVGIKKEIIKPSGEMKIVKFEYKGKIEGKINKPSKSNKESKENKPVSKAKENKPAGKLSSKMIKDNLNVLFPISDKNGELEI